MAYYPSCYIQLAKTNEELMIEYSKEAHFYALNKQPLKESIARLRSEYFRYYAEKDKALRAKEDSANA